MTKTRAPGFLTLSLALLAPPAFASGGGSIPVMRQPAPSAEQLAAELYNDAVSHREKADKYEKEAATETDAKKKEKLSGKSRKEHESAIKKLTSATEKNPMLFQAFGNLGYSYRKTGDFTAALAAYDKSLALESGYSPAIEYRAEAYLGLNRLDDVKSAYMYLFNVDRARADELATAMDAWLSQRKANPAGLDAQALQEFETWTSQRKQIASQTSSLTSRDARW